MYNRIMDSSKSLFLKLTGILLTVLALAFVWRSLVSAQANQTITIIPPKFELFANPGDSLAEKIRIRNESDFPVTYSVLIEDFTTSGEEGHVVLEEGEQSTSFSLAQWIEPQSKDLVLQPKEEVPFTFVVNVPRDAEPGGHYASILFQTGGENTTPGTTAVAQRVGALVLLRVSGNVTEDAKIESFTVPDYQESGPVVFTLRIKNDGNVHISPQGTIVITNIFKQKVAEIPLDTRNVLPGAIRKMETTWDQEHLLGKFTATLISTYGQQKKPLTAAVTFTVASKTAIILLIVGGIALIGFIITLITGRRRFFKALKVIFSGG